ncbi:MAG: DNA polymerase [Candidatus Gracilibacteria bacterium]|nr:DNA polymerase [Candidatus Gracilibacteria bacterium]
MTKFYDTLIGEYISNPGKKGLSLDNLAERYFDYRMISYEEITLKGELNFSEVELIAGANYSAEDVYITSKIYNKQVENGIINDKVLNEIEIPLIEVLKNTEIAGVKVSSEKLNEIGKILEIEIKKEENIIKEIAGEDFNIKSPKQVGEILFEKMGLPEGKKTKTGFSVDNEVLESLSLKYPIARHIVNYRTYTKLLSTYVEGLGKLIDSDGKIHTSYNQTITTTGRLSSTNPNLQNIPSSNGIGGTIREAFIPFEENDLLVAFDYSQIEVRLLAIMSKDENLLGSFLSGIDIHANTGYFLFGKDSLTTDERRIAKAVNFGVIYGISPFGLSKMIGVSQSEAREYINKFYEKYPKVLDFFDKTIEFCEKNGYVETMFGRKRFISSITDSNSLIKKSAEREAINMPIQGTSADIIKLAMIKAQKFLHENNLKSKMIMQVHDELVFNVVPEEFELIKKEIPNIMENIISAPIKLIVDMGVGKNWRECK